MNDIIINGGSVLIQNTPPPPYSNKDLTKRKRHFKRCLKIGKLRFYITWNFRLKNSQSRENSTDFDHKQAVRTKEMVWQRSGHRCEICGKEISKFSRAQMHHVLPWCLFREYEFDERNLMLLCNDCHRHIHTNPFLECKMITEKAKELGVELKDYYEV